MNKNGNYHRRRWETLEKIVVYTICAFISTTLTLGVKLIYDASERLNAVEISTLKNTQLVDLLVGHIKDKQRE